MRKTAERRHNDWRKAIRKRRIDRELQGSSIYEHDWYDNLHQYSKNKIHCSCPICSNKTNNKGKKVWGSTSRNWSISDKRKLEEMDNQILDNE